MNKKILVVDDDEYWRNRAKEEVTPFGYEIVEADGFHAGQCAIEEHEGSLVLVVCDNSMPIGDRTFPNAGLDIRGDMHFTSDAQAAVPFVLFTSELSTEQRELATKLKAETVLKRREVEGDLRAVVRRILDL